MDLLKSIIIVSEKAANIARICRQNKYLFSLLIQKKRSEEANPRFVDDFKTLADVLIQEMVKLNIKKKFQELHVLGEENNIFENKLGDKICVEVKNTEEETCHLLEKVLNGDHIAAKLLAAEVHRDINEVDIQTNLPYDLNILTEQLGMWIDPIDCTAEYINGSEGEQHEDIFINGLQCVTILIGVFDKKNGCPLMGVINRPFAERVNCGFLWGISSNTTNLNCGIDNIEGKRIVCISSSERSDIKEKLKNNNFQLIEASGAGYKILTVILGLADAYVLSKGTTFKWDTCAPHSILKSIGGDIIDFQIALRNNIQSVKYFVDESNCNTSGIIAYRQQEILNDLIDALKGIVI